MDFADDFKDKIAIVTGSAGGLGRETAVRFASAGARVVLCDVKEAQGKKTADEIVSKGGDAVFMSVDVSSEASAQDLVKRVVDRFGGVHILVNSAGVTGKGFRSFIKIDVSEWDRTYQVNVKGTVNCCRAVYPIFRRQGAGKIVNVASIAGRMPTKGLIHYAASKAAVINFTQSLAAELAPHNINVNAVCPGWIWTPIYNESEDLVRLAERQGITPREAFLEMVKTMCPMQREQTEEDIANAILFLASEAAKNITGQSINVDGGAVMS
jgi:meso-butanediol dehydrogenase / (S,S)-butanediol dehydrogenase / diacetyl reductase